MRIRTSNKPHRKDVIDRAASFYDCNKTDALMYAADDVPQLVEGVREVLDRDDLTIQQKREIAETFSAKGVDVTIDETLSVELG